MEQKELEVQYKLERDICSGANASEYHKKRFAELAKELNIVIAEKAVDAKPEEKTETSSEPATVEETETVTTESSEIEEVAVEATTKES